MGYQIAPTPIERKSLPTRGIQTSPPLWMNQKKKRDQELWSMNKDKYWIVQNKMYDLSSYVNNHPGGESWLRLTQGQDVTEHFIVHHLNQNKARQVLEKYYIGDCPTKIVRFTFEENGLYRTFKRRVLSKFTVSELQDESTSKIYAFVILFLWVACLSFAIYFHSYLLGMLCAPLMVGLVGIGHNFVHHKQSFYRYFLLLAGFTHKQWQIMHCISHHLYPNTELDYEIAAFEPLGYYLRSMPENKWYFQIVLEVLFFFLQPINMILKLIVIPILKFTKPDLLYSVPMLILSIIYINSQSFWDALKLYLTIYCCFGFLLMKVLFCGHRVQDTWTEGAEKIEDFGQHTVYATSDTDTWIHGIFSYTLLAGFNIHVCHHLFPTADHHILPEINKMLTQICLERGIKRNQKTRISCLASIYRGFNNRIPFSRK